MIILNRQVSMKDDKYKVGVVKSIGKAENSGYLISVLFDGNS